MNALQRARLAYRDLGLSTVLVGQNKNPILSGWPMRAVLATRDEMARETSHAIGLLCGHWVHALPEPDDARTWIMVADFDAKLFAFDAGKHPPNWERFAGWTGLDTLDALVSMHGPMPPTWQQLTPTGGFHFVFRHPGPPVRIPTRAGVLPGFDVRGDNNGQVLAAPSPHPKGGTYTWEASSRPGEAPLADAPKWLLDIAATTRPKAETAKHGTGASSFLGLAFDALGWLGAQHSEGIVDARCPWAHLHSDGRGAGDDSSCVILPPRKAGDLGWLRCEHSHTEGRTMREVLMALPPEALALATTQLPNAGETAMRVLTGQVKQ